jgi:aconitate hydratase
MASKKKAKKSRRPAKKAKAVKRKTAAKKKSKGVKKAARKAPARKTAKAAKKTAARKPAAKRKKAPARKKKQTVGEGDYAASRSFLKDQAGFVKKNKAQIPALGRAAKSALEGAEGAALRAAETTARSHSKAGPGEATIAAAEQDALDRNAN